MKKSFINLFYSTAITIFVLSFTNKVQAQDSIAKTVAPSPVTIWGYGDLYYSYNFNNPESRTIGEMASRGSHIYSHTRNNEFNLNNAILGIKYNKDKIRSAFALHAGTYVSANYSAEPDVLKNIFEAYAGYQLGKKVWVDAGIFASHIGFESAMSFACATLSRSIMADNTPYFESGVKVTYEPSSKLVLTGLVLNGWQNIIDHNKNKALGSQIQYKPSSNVLINWSTFFGKEAGAYETTSGIVNTDSLSTRRFFHNLYMQANLTKKLSMITAFDIGFQKKRNASGDNVWYNPNLILRYAITDKIAVAGRGEYYSDKNGVIISSGTTNGYQAFAGSLNLDYKLADNILWRIEGKIFNSKDKAYAKENKLSNQSILVLSSLAIKF